MLLVVAAVTVPTATHAVGTQETPDPTAVAGDGHDWTVPPRSGSVDATPNRSTTVTAGVRDLLSAAWRNETRARFVSRSDGGTRIRVTIDAVAGRGGDVVALARQHGTVATRFAGSIEAVLPPEAVERMAGSPAVSSIRRPTPAVGSHQGSVVSEGLPNVNVTPSLHASGITGSNVTVAVVDTGFDPSNPEIEHHVAGFEDFEGDGMDNETGLHGTAVAELLVDVAPAVSLRLYEVNTSAQIGAVARHVTHNTSTDIAVMSLGLLTGPFDGTSAVDRAIGDSVDGGTAWVVSAGNYADGTHYDQPWRDRNGDGWLTVSGSRRAITVDADGGFEAYVNWADENASHEDYDAYLNRSGVAIDRSTTRQDGAARASEVVTAGEAGEYSLRIRNHDANGTADFDVFVSGNADLIPHTSARSLVRPATGRSVIAVGATYYRDDGLEETSSRGPTIDGRTKPELVGPDGVSTSQGATGRFDPFFGTSAAAPHVAGVAALVIDSLNGSIEVPELRESLLSGATRLDARVPNNRTGYGLVNATGAIAAAENATAEPRKPLVLNGGSTHPATAEASTVASHEVRVAFDNVSRDGETDRFDIGFPDAVGSAGLSVVDISAAVRSDGAGIPVEDATRVDGTDRDGVRETIRVAVSPTGGGTVDLRVNLSVDITWPGVDADTVYPVSVAGRDSSTGSVASTVIGNVTVIANAAPTPTIALDRGVPAVGAVTTLDASSSTDADGRIDRYEWVVDGTVIGRGETITHTFRSPGEHEVGLTVTDDDGATATATRTIRVNSPPVAHIVASTGTPAVGESITFDASTSIDADGGIAAYEWDLDGDGTFDDATGPETGVAFDIAGNRTVGLRVVDRDGASNVTRTRITVTGGSTDSEEPPGTGETVTDAPGLSGFGPLIAVLALIAVARFARRNEERENGDRTQ
jgi:subtilisin family serine protease